MTTGQGWALRRGLCVALAVAATLGGSGCGGSRCGPTAGTVTTVVDGDTFELQTDDGKKEKVRLLLVDAPEITSGKNDCYGQQAASFTGNAIAGQRVELAYDEGQCSDRFGRLLAYVTVAGDDLNAELVKQGYACRLFIPPGGTSRAEEFAGYEQDARNGRKGVWGACNPVTCAE